MLCTYTVFVYTLYYGQRCSSPGRCANISLQACPDFHNSRTHVPDYRNDVSGRRGNGTGAYLVNMALATSKSDGVDACKMLLLSRSSVCGDQPEILSNLLDGGENSGGLFPMKHSIPLKVFGAYLIRARKSSGCSFDTSDISRRHMHRSSNKLYQFL